MANYKEISKAYYLDTKDWLDGYTEYDTKKKYYKIIAYSGDKSSHGMGNKATQYRIPADKVDIVDRFIFVTEKFTEYCVLTMTMKKSESEYSKKLWDLYMKAMDSMDFIFKDKWDYRSNWCWIESPPVSIRYHKDELLKNKEVA
jgi:hypothetical protein